MDGAAAPIRLPLWNYGANDHIEELPADCTKDFEPTGNLRYDFAKLCLAGGVVPHAAFLPPLPEPPKEEKPLKRGSSRTGNNRDSNLSPGPPDRSVLTVGQMPREPIAEGPHLAISSALLDLPTMQVLKLVLPTSHHLQTLKFSGCKLDIDQLALLRAALGESSTVSQLQIDWNPLEEPADVAALKKLGAEGTLEELDEIEHQRFKRQCERTLRVFGETLQILMGSPEDVLPAVAQVADPEHAATSMLAPLPCADWVKAFDERLGLRSDDVEPVFHILDGPDYGTGDGLVPMSRAEAVLKDLPERTPEQEEKDPFGAAFAALVDGTSVLEVVSLRYCELGRVEAQAIARSLRNAQHLRALNLWGNRICDRGAAALGEAFQYNFGLQYLGLGRNLITHVGLEEICKNLGSSIVTDKKEAERIQKEVKDRQKEKDKKLSGKGAVGPKKDAAGRDRYTPDMYVGSCEPSTDEDGNPTWIYVRNCTLRTLVLESNPLSDAAAVRRLVPLGPPGGNLLIRNTPSAREILEVQKAEAAAKAEAEGSGAAQIPTAAEPPANSPDPDAASPQPPQQGGWNLVLQ